MISSAFSAFYPFLTTVVALVLCYLCSIDRSKVSIKFVGIGVLLQIICTIAVAKVPVIISSLEAVDRVFEYMSRSTAKGLGTCLGALGDPSGPLGFILSIHGFGIVILVSSISALLVHLGILQKIAKLCSIVLKRPFGLGEVAAFSPIINIVVGISQTPLIIKDYVNKMSRFELFSVICCGMSTICFPMIPILKSIIGDYVENASIHLIGSMLISIPITLTLARIVVPDSEGVHTSCDITTTSKNTSAIDVIIGGMLAGGKLIIIITTIIIGIVALVDVIDTLLQFLPNVYGEPLSLHRILGALFYPIAVMIGVPLEEAHQIAGILGEKIVTNETIGLTHLAKMHELSASTRIIGVYLLSNFACIGSCGIALGVYSSIMPERHQIVAQVIWRSLLVGIMSACVCASMMGALFSSAH